ncbi:hypothetical protein Q4601_12020 [Shewanella sp. 1_MG-2023]|uniref:hypothetical protein n=1 Tax=unclassified Shewanella TaxID=196818 RepID=UPI0026E37A83|nr:MULTISPECIES: hypothetical protein [unclassified Shewanella]MDO6610526.1 hypothetical protein [Shewanella sp. 7_MG-2023]MDO6770651.1 hypothetical protein [Shewanella sp. 2_MG-2023]MDO6795037.1 hypothetical protein [Shewanella sp. 1_MG-2023]
MSNLFDSNVVYLASYKTVSPDSVPTSKIVHNVVANVLSYANGLCPFLDVTVKDSLAKMSRDLVQERVSTQKSVCSLEADEMVQEITDFLCNALEQKFKLMAEGL